MRLKAEILPYDAADPDVMLDELMRAGFIRRYVADNRRCILVVSFEKQQHPHPKEACSDLPLPLPLPLEATADPGNSGTNRALPSFPSFPSIPSFINTIEQPPVARAPVLDAHNVDKTAKQVFDFESIYALYPNKKGKAIGLRKCKAKIRTQEDFDAFKRGVIAYAAECRRNGTEKRFIQHFKTFVEQERWKDPPEQMPAVALAQSTRTTLQKIDEARKQAAPPPDEAQQALDRLKQGKA